MTTSEFKEKYPQYAHLEGNALWNQMEDTFLKENKEVIIHEVRDWKGNLVEPGMELVVITTKIEHMQSGMIYTDEDGNRKSFMFPKKPDEEAWEVSDAVKVYLREDGSLWYDGQAGEFTFSCPLSMVLFSITSNRLLAIKGISDTK